MNGDSPTGLYTTDPEYDQLHPEIGPSTLREAFSAGYLEMLSHGPVINELLGSRINELQKADPTQAEGIRQARQTVNNRISDLIDRRPSGLLGFGSVLLGQLAGFTSDPVNAAMGLAAPEFIGTKATELGNSLGEAAAARGASIGAQRAVRVLPALGAGAIEGAAVMAPGELTHLQMAHPFHDDFNAMDALTNVGYGAGLGAVLGGLGRSIGMIKEDRLAAMRETAANQMEQDIQPNIGPVVREGAVASKADMTDEMMEDVQARQTELSAQSDALDQQIKDARTELDAKAPEELVAAHDALPADEYIQRIIRAAGKPMADRTAYEQSALMPEHQPLEVKRVLDRIRQSDAPLTADEQDALQAWQASGDEGAMKAKARILKQGIQKAKPAQRQALQDELGLTERRIAALKPVEENPIEMAQRNLENLQEQKAQIGDLQDRNQALLDFGRSSIPQVNRTDLHEFADHQNTNLGDDMAPREDQTPLEQEASMAPEQPHELEKEMEATIQQLEDEGQLTLDQLQKLNDVDTELREQANYKKLLAAAKNCLTRTLGI